MEGLLGEGKWDIACFCETRLRDPAVTQLRLSESGWAGVWGTAADGPLARRTRPRRERERVPGQPEPAEGSEGRDVHPPSGGVSREGPDLRDTTVMGPNPTRERMQRSTSAGVCIVWKKHLAIRELDTHFVSGVDPGDEFWSRVCFSMLRVKGHNIVLGTVYLWTGEGMSARNLSILTRVSEVFALTGVSGILTGDFQATQSEIRDTAWFRVCGLHFIGTGEPTCFVGPPADIDHVLVTRDLAGLMSAPTTVATPRRDHLGLEVGIPRRPRALWGEQLIGVGASISNPGKVYPGIRNFGTSVGVRLREFREASWPRMARLRPPRKPLGTRSSNGPGRPSCI